MRAMPQLRTGPGADVGPPLSGVASRLACEQLLEALVDPSARMAPGYGPVQLTLKNGQSLFGTPSDETDAYIVVDAGTEPRKIVKTDIAQRTNGPSAMPAMVGVLTRRELRDVVEYLSALKQITSPRIPDNSGGHYRQFVGMLVCPARKR